MLPTREHPWNARLVAAKHHQWLGRLGTLHRLTRGWMEEVRVLRTEDRKDHSLSRGLSSEVSQNLWMLERLSSQGAQKIEPLLDDTTPDDVLGRLERTAWSVQAWTLLTLKTDLPESEKPALDAVLEQVAWKQGRQTAEESWPSLATSGTTELRSLLLALGASLLSGGSGGGDSESFLVRRALSQEVILELRSCPHQTPYCAAIAPADVIDRLCQVHAHWMRGFAYVLNHRAGLEHQIAASCGTRCTQRWHLHNNG